MVWTLEAAEAAAVAAVGGSALSLCSKYLSCSGAWDDDAVWGLVRIWEVGGGRRGGWERRACRSWPGAVGVSEAAETG